MSKTLIPASLRGMTREAMFSLFWAILLAFQSMFPWFLWDTQILHGAFVVIFCVCSFNMVSKKLNTSMSLYMLFLTLFTVFHAKLGGVGILSTFNRIISMLPLFMFPLFHLQYKRAFLHIVITIYAAIMAVSLVFFAAWMSGVRLPHGVLINSNPFYPPFDNYYFFIIIKDFGAMTRFSSIFTEPGHVGMISSLLLFLNKYTFRDWRNIAMTVALLWSFSLAGYMLYLFGYILHTVASKQSSLIKIRKIALLILGIVLAIGVIGYFNRSILDEKILSRLEFTSSGELEGNNRNTGFFEIIYDSLETEDLIFGMDEEEYVRRQLDVNNSSYKNFIMKDGIIGLVLIAIVFALYLRAYPSRYGTAYFILMVLSFMQRPYILWEMESLPYLAALAVFHYDQTDRKQRKNKKKPTLMKHVNTSMKPQPC